MQWSHHGDKEEQLPYIVSVFLRQRQSVSKFGHRDLHI